MPAIEVDNLSVDVGGGASLIRAVDGVSFAVTAGEVVALLGPNGAGKTTTVETIEGYRAPTAGRVAVLGLDPMQERAAVARLLGAMPQSGRLYSAIRPREAVRLFASYYGDPEDPDSLLERVGLAERARTPWRRLSGGEQQRLSLALALVGRPAAVVLDEPTAGLDLDGRRLVRGLVAELAEREVAVLVTTHELDEAERMADRAVIIDRGRVRAEGAVADLTRQAGPPDVRFSTSAGLDTAALGTHLGGRVTEVASGEYVAAVEPTPDQVARLTAWLADHDMTLGSLRATEHRLEDVFARLTGQEERR
jgi:ABC-2 type transport system ATP-binding protein